MSIDEWSEPHDEAIWFRAAEHLDVPVGGIVPGPLDIEPLPAGPAGPHDDLAAGWLGWWQALSQLPRWPPAEAIDLVGELGPMAGPPPPAGQFRPPDFPGLAGWPALQRRVGQRWPEANRWHNERKIAGVAARRHRRPLAREGRLVAEVERELGRRVPPFDVEFIVVPVRDTQIRQLTETRYLVPEAVYAGAQWTARLRTLVVTLAGVASAEVSAR
jgi:hypothetical protein